jgi:hypothetical protein
MRHAQSPDWVGNPYCRPIGDGLVTLRGPRLPSMALDGCRVQVSPAALISAGSGVFPLRRHAACWAAVMVAGHDRNCRCHGARRRSRSSRVRRVKRLAAVRGAGRSRQQHALLPPPPSSGRSTAGPAYRAPRAATDAHHPGRPTAWALRVAGEGRPQPAVLEAVSLATGGRRPIRVRHLRMVSRRDAAGPWPGRGQGVSCWLRGSPGGVRIRLARRAAAGVR